LIKLTFIFRNPVKGFYSIEKIFARIMTGIDRFSVSSIQLPYTGSNVFHVVFNCLFLLKFRDGIFHITGHDHYAALFLPRRTTILTIHDLIFLRNYSGWKKILLRWFLLELPVKRCLYITTVSEQTRQEIFSLVKCDPSKISVMPNPVRFSSIPPRLNSGLNYPVLLFIGTHPNKNLQNVIPSLVGMKVHLRILGRLNQANKALLEKFSIDFSNRYDLSDDDLQSEYATADLLLFPSNYEGFGLPIIEAFQHGLPVITSTLPPMSEVAGDAAILVDPEAIISIRKAVIYLTKDPNLSEAYRTKGYIQVRNFNIEKITTLYQEMYNRVAIASNT
jgi:glycosyltransferase involved in cell wall biosynthesis